MIELIVMWGCLISGTIFFTSPFWAYIVWLLTEGKSENIKCQTYNIDINEIDEEFWRNYEKS